MRFVWSCVIAVNCVLAWGSAQAWQAELPKEYVKSQNGVFRAKSDGWKIRIEMLPRKDYFNKFYFSIPKTRINSFHWDLVESEDSIATILVVNDTIKIEIMNETKGGFYRAYRYPMEKNALEGWIRTEKYNFKQNRWKTTDSPLSLIDTYNGFWLKYVGSKLVLKRCYRLICNSSDILVSRVVADLKH